MRYRGLSGREFSLDRYFQCKKEEFEVQHKGLLLV
jgi:hypothetical protein